MATTCIHNSLCTLPKHGPFPKWFLYFCLNFLSLSRLTLLEKPIQDLMYRLNQVNTPAFLPRMHLSDHVTHCGPLLQIFSSSLENTAVKSLNNVLYYGRNHDKTHVSLLLKFYIFYNIDIIVLQ